MSPRSYIPYTVLEDAITFHREKTYLDLDPLSLITLHDISASHDHRRTSKRPLAVRARLLKVHKDATELISYNMTEAEADSRLTK